MKDDSHLTISLLISLPVDLANLSQLPGKEGDLAENRGQWVEVPLGFLGLINRTMALSVEGRI
jgi:hypothetical protein